MVWERERERELAKWEIDMDGSCKFRWGESTVRDRYGVKGTCSLEGVFIQFSNYDKKEGNGTFGTWWYVCVSSSAPSNNSPFIYIYNPCIAWAAVAKFSFQSCASTREVKRNLGLERRHCGFSTLVYIYKPLSHSTTKESTLL